MPRRVSATRCSSSNAGTTTATRLPSTISALLRDAPRGPSLEERIGDRGGERSEQEADQPADQGSVAPARRGRLARQGALHDLALLHVLGQREQLLILEQLLLDGAASLFREADRVVEAGDHDQLVRLR